MLWICPNQCESKKLADKSNLNLWKPLAQLSHSSNSPYPSNPFGEVPQLVFMIAIGSAKNQVTGRSNSLNTPIVVA